MRRKERGRVQARFVRAVRAAGVGGGVTGQHLVEARSGLGVTQQRLGSEDDQLGTQTGSWSRDIRLNSMFSQGDS